jgi:hypothetical protein
MHIDSGNQPNELYHIIHFLIESIFYSMRRSRRSTHSHFVGRAYIFFSALDNIQGTKFEYANYLLSFLLTGLKVTTLI